MHATNICLSLNTGKYNVQDNENNNIKLSAIEAEKLRSDLNTLKELSSENNLYDNNMRNISLDMSTHLRPYEKIKSNDVYLNNQIDILEDKWLSKLKINNENFKNDLTVLSPNYVLNNFFNLDTNKTELSNLVDRVNPIFNKFREKYNFNSTDNTEKTYIKFDGKILTIDLENTFDLIKNTSHFLYNSEYIYNIGIYGSMGIGAGLLYSNIVKAYASSIDSVLKLPEFQNLSEDKKKEFISELTKNKKIFNVTGGVLLVISLYAIIRSIAKVRPFDYSVSIKSGSASSDINKSIFLPFLSNTNKNLPKWLRYTMIFIITMIFFYIVHFLYPVESHVLFKYLKILTLLFIIWLTLYNLLSALIIIICNSNKKDITIFNYYPKYIKNRLNYLMKIRKYESNNLFILLYLKTSLFAFLLLLILIILIFVFK